MITLHVSSINRPLVKCRGPIQSNEEHQKDPCKSAKEYQTDEDLAVSHRTNYHKHLCHQKNYIYTKGTWHNFKSISKIKIYDI